MLSWPWLVLSCLSLFVYGLGDNARGPVFPDVLQEFHLSSSNGALFFLVCSAAAVANNIVAMRWMHRIGSYRTLLVYTGVQAFAFLMLGVLHSYFGVLVAAAILGLSMGGLAVAQNSMAAQSAKAERRRQALALFQCMYGASSLLAPLLVNVLYRNDLTWHAVFILLSGVTAIFFVGVWTQRHQPSPHEVAADRMESETPVFAKSPPLESVTSVEGARARWVIVHYSLLIALYTVAEVGISTRFVQYTRADLGASPEQANWLLSLFFVGLFAGRLALAIWRIPVRSQWALMISAGSAMTCLCLGLYASPLWLSLSGLMMSIYYPCVIALIHEDHRAEEGRSHAERAARVTSWGVTIQCLSLVIMHFGLGAATDMWGVRAALWEAPVSLAALLVLLGLHGVIKSRLAVGSAPVGALS